MLGERFRSRGAPADVLPNGSQGLLKTRMACTLNKEVPHPQHGKPRLYQGHQLLIEDEKLAERKPSEDSEAKRRLAAGCSSRLQLKDEIPFPFQFCSNDLLIFALYL